MVYLELINRKTLIPLRKDKYFEKQFNTRLIFSADLSHPKLRRNVFRSDSEEKNPIFYQKKWD